jgi:membrane-bound lytic murein transglycosylase A
MFFLRRVAQGSLLTLILGLLAACAVEPPAQPMAQVPQAPVSSSVQPPPAAPAQQPATTTAPPARPAAEPVTAASGIAVARAAEPVPPAEPARVIQRVASRWVAVDWTELPGWPTDRTSEFWPALLRGCDKPAPGWAAVCAAARSAARPGDDAEARAWLQQRLRPYRIEAADGAAEGLITGYVEARIDARRQPSSAARVPIYAPPVDLASRQPYWTRKELDTLPAARKALRGRALAYAADPLDVLYLQIQGSGRVQIREADGSTTIARLTYAGHNGHPYRSVGKWLIEKGELRTDGASWSDIKAWAQRNPKRLNDLLWSNPRVVFFREEPLADAQIAPVGGQGIPLTPGRSIAVDVQSIPYGTPVWLDTTEPLSNAPLRRIVMAQDTGSAIVGAVRADYFWGWGDEADALAGRMKQPLRMWALWPGAATPP